MIMQRVNFRALPRLAGGRRSIGAVSRGVNSVPDIGGAGASLSYPIAVEMK